MFTPPRTLSASATDAKAHLSAVSPTTADNLSYCHSLADNTLTNYGKDMSGVTAIAEALKGNATLQSLKCALPFSPLPD